MTAVIKSAFKHGKVLWIVLLFAGCQGIRSPEENAARQEWKAARSSIDQTKGELPSLSDSAGLNDYLAYAALNNPELEAAFNQWKAALETVTAARTLPDPRFNYGYFIREVETRVGPQEQRFGLSQMFPWFGKLRLKGDIALENADAARQQYEAKKLKLFYQVKDAYYELFYLRRAIAITEDNMRLLKHLESVAQTKFKAGGPMAGVTKAQVELSKLSDRLRSLTDLRQPLTAKLNAVLNRPPDAAIPWPQSVSGQETQLEDRRLYQWLAERNPELQGLDAMIRKEEQAVRLAKKDYFPDFTLGVDYIQTGDALMAGTPDDSKDPVAATLSINLPLWWGKYRAGVDGARARQQAAEQTRVNRENLLLSDLKMALYRYRDAERKIDLFGDTLIPQANQSLKVAQQSYEAGEADFLDLIDAQRQLLAFQLEFERAQVDREQRLAEIEKLVAHSLPSNSTDPNPSQE